MGLSKQQQGNIKRCSDHPQISTRTVWSRATPRHGLVVCLPVMSSLYSSPLYQSLFPWWLLHTHGKGLIDCQSRRFDIQRIVNLSDNPLHEALWTEKGMGTQAWVSARASKSPLQWPSHSGKCVCINHPSVIIATDDSRSKCVCEWCGKVNLCKSQLFYLWICL